MLQVQSQNAYKLKDHPLTFTWMLWLHVVCTSTTQAHRVYGYVYVHAYLYKKFFVEQIK